MSFNNGTAVVIPTEENGRTFWTFGIVIEGDKVRVFRKMFKDGCGITGYHDVDMSPNVFRVPEYNGVPDYR